VQLVFARLPLLNGHGSFYKKNNEDNNDLQSVAKEHMFIRDVLEFDFVAAHSLTRGEEQQTPAAAPDCNTD